MGLETFILKFFIICRVWSYILKCFQANDHTCEIVVVKPVNCLKGVLSIGAMPHYNKFNAFPYSHSKLTSKNIVIVKIKNIDLVNG